MDYAALAVASVISGYIIGFISGYSWTLRSVETYLQKAKQRTAVNDLNPHK